MDYTFDYSRTFDDEKDDLIEKFNSYEKFMHEKIQSGELKLYMIDFYSLSKNESITENFIMKYPEFKWVYYEILRYPKLSQNFILKNKDFFENYKSYILSNGNITINFLKNILGYKIEMGSWVYLSSNPSLTSEDLDNYITKFNFQLLLKNPCINMDFVYKHYENIKKNNLFYELYENPSFDISLVGTEKFPLIDFNELNSLLSNPNLTIDIVNKFIDNFNNGNFGDDNFSYLSDNINLDLKKLINKFPKKDWDWDMISKNKNLTIDFVRKFKKKLNFNILSENLVLQ